MYMMYQVLLVFQVCLVFLVCLVILVDQVLLVYLVHLVMMVHLDNLAHLDRSDDNDVVCAVCHSQFQLCNMFLIFLLAHEDAYDDEVDDDVFFYDAEYLDYLVELELFHHVMMLHLV